MLLKNQDFWHVALRHYPVCSQHTKDNAACEMSGTPHPATQRYIPEESLVET
jgi:hypothetical protein